MKTTWNRMIQRFPVSEKAAARQFHGATATTASPGDPTRDRVKRVVYSVSALWVFAGVGALLGLGAQAILARRLSVDGFGAVSTAVAVVGLATPIAGFGMAQYWLQLFGHEGWGALPTARRTLTITAVSTLITMGLLLGLASSGAYDHLTRSVLLLITPFIMCSVAMGLAAARAQLEDRTLAIAWMQLAPTVPKVVAACIAAVTANAVMAAGGYGVSSLGLALLGVLLVVGMFQGRFRLVGHPAAGTRDGRVDALPSTQIVAQALPYVLTSALYMIFFQIDVAMLGWQKGAGAVAPYSAAVTIVLGAYLLPSVLADRYMLPRMHRWSAQSRGKLADVTRVAALGFGASGLLVGALVALGSGWIMSTIFGAGYGSYAPLLMLLCIAIPFRYFSTGIGTAVVTDVGPRSKVVAMAIASAENVILNLWLIPRFSFYGSAIATILSEVTLAGIYVFFVRRALFSGRPFGSG